MSGKQMGKVYDHVFDQRQQLVLLALADHAEHDGTNIHPGERRLAWKTGYSVRSVRRILKELREMGVLVRVSKAEPHKGLADEYRLDWSKATPKQPFPKAENTPANLSGTIPAKSGDIPAKAMSAQPSLTTVNKKPSSDSKNESSEGAEQQALPSLENMDKINAKHPAVQTYRRVFRRYPKKAWYKRIIDVVGGEPDLVALWEDTCRLWAEREWNPASVDKMLHRFRARLEERGGTPTRRGSASDDDERESMFERFARRFGGSRTAAYLDWYYDGWDEGTGLAIETGAPPRDDEAALAAFMRRRPDLFPELEEERAT